MAAPGRNATVGRRAGIAVGVVLAVIVATAGGTALGWEGLRRYRPALEPGQSYGIDVSWHQGPVAWDRVADHGIEYAYIKATEGATWTDERFAENWEGAEAAGVRRGAYHFFSLCSSGDEQLAHFLDVVPVDDAALPPAIDLEYSACRERPEAAHLQRDLEVFVQGVEAAWEREVVLYVLPEFADRYPFVRELDRRQWVRRLLREPERDWDIWQVSNLARIEGISGEVDLNVWGYAPATG